MKKFGLLLITTLIAATISSCNDSEGDYPKYQPLITTVRTLDADNYYFLRDNGQKLYAGDKSRINGYKAKDRQRAIIWFNLLSEAIEGYDYNVALYAIDDIYTGTSQVITTAEELEALGDSETSITPEQCNLSKEWLTLYVGYPVTDNDKHKFSVIINEVEEPEERNEGYLDVELRHHAGGDVGGYTYGFYVSFDLTPIQSELEGKKGVTLRVKTQQNGIKYIRFDLPQEK